MMTFEWPWVFFLLPLPWIARYFLSPVLGGEIALPFGHELVQVGGFKVQTTYFSRNMILPLLIWLSLLLAAARPIWQGEPIQLPVLGREMMVVLDLSGSMQMEDFDLDGKQVNRLASAKKVLYRFIAKRNGDRIGLILFGDRPYLQSPITYDLKTVQTFLSEAQIGLAGEKTAIGDAIALAVKHLLPLPATERVIVILTDGANTAGLLPPLEAAKIAQENKVKIYTIGMGADAVWVQDFFGRHKMNPSVDLDEKMLTTIAEMTEGAYFRAKNTAGLNAIYDEINRLEPIQHDDRYYRPKKALFIWPLGFCLILGGLTILRRFRVGG